MKPSLALLMAIWTVSCVPVCTTTLSDHELYERVTKHVGDLCSANSAGKTSRDIYETTCDQARAALEFLKSKPVRIAVTGQTGVGKSTFVNTMRGLRPDDEGAAGVCAGKECTEDKICYPSPVNTNVQYCDLPGCGSTRFPCNTYIKDFELDNYDIIIHVSDARRAGVLQNDRTLYDALKFAGKQNVFLVVNFINIVLDNAKEDFPKTYQEHAEKEKIRNQMVKSFACLERDVFLVSTKFKHSTSYEMPPLMRTVVASLGGAAASTLVSTLSVGLAKAFDASISDMEAEAWKQSRIAILGKIGSSFVNPIPFGNIPVSLALMHYLKNQILRIFKVDDDSMMAEMEAAGIEIGSRAAEFVLMAVSPEALSDVLFAVNEGTLVAAFNYVNDHVDDDFKYDAVATGAEYLHSALDFASDWGISFVDKFSDFMESATELGSGIPMIGPLLTSGITYKLSMYSASRMINEAKTKRERFLKAIIERVGKPEL